MILLSVPFLLQALAMALDELYFHRKRGLPKWEIIGHPLDTLTVLTAYGFLWLNEPNEYHLKIYLFLAAFSCLFITKDEWVHTQFCDADENWLHAVLFVLHPITFFSAGIIWFYGLSQTFLMIQPIVVLLVMLYQIFYWSFYVKSKK